MNSENLGDLLPIQRIELLSPESLVEWDKTGLLKYLLARTLALGKAEMSKDYESIWQNLREREASMSTGVGLGVAMPHCSSPCVHDLCMYMTILSQSIDFQSIDDIPVRIVLLILFPQQKFERHVHLLSCLARILNEAQTREKILSSSEPSKVREIMLHANGHSEKKLEQVKKQTVRK